MDSTSLLDQLFGYWSALDQHPILHAGLTFGLLLVGALILGRVTHCIVPYAANLLARQPALHWLGDLVHNKVFQRLAQITPPLLVRFGLPWIPEMPDKAAHFLGNPALVFTVLFLILTLTTLLNALLDIYTRTEHARTRPIKGYMQPAKIAVFVFGATIVVSIIIDRSPLLLLPGLGVISTVLLLAYKDTLISFIASVQLIGNDVLRVDDWIEMPQIGADDDVVDTTLYTVKVQNFGKTIISVPTRRLMSESFKNWRGMQQSDGRRVKRAIYVDSSQVHSPDEKEERHLGQVRLLTEYMARKQAELQEQNAANGGVTPLAASRCRLTNIDTFRAYALTYLQNHPDIRPHVTCMIRQLQPTAQGIPLEIYCFTRTTAWVDYERIQGNMFGYLLAVIPGFGLGTHQHPSGQDLRQGLQGMLEGCDAGARSFEALATPSHSDEATA